MSVINQPRAGCLGDTLTDLLNSRDNFHAYKLYIISAYAKRSGIIRLQAAIQSFCDRGGEVISIVGIDQKNTTIQGLRLLFEISNELYIYHSESISQTFHPKVYVF